MFERVPDLLGYLVLNEEGAILSSGGDLENAEATANVFITIIGLTDKLGDDEKYRKLSIIYSDCTYMTCKSNRNYYIVKRRYQPPPPPPSFSAEEDPSASGDLQPVTPSLP